MRQSWRQFWSWLRPRENPSRVVPAAELRERLQAELQASSQGTPAPFSLVQLSLDAYGDLLHRRGIEAAANLLEVAIGVLVQQTSPPAVVARGRVPELMILLPDTDAPKARALFERVRSALKTAGTVSFSTGIVTSVDHSLATPQVLQLAYQAMYDAQRQEAVHLDHRVIRDLQATSYRPSGPNSGASPGQPPDSPPQGRMSGPPTVDPTPRQAG